MLVHCLICLFAVVVIPNLRPFDHYSTCLFSLCCHTMPSAPPSSACHKNKKDAVPEQKVDRRSNWWGGSCPEDRGVYRGYVSSLVYVTAKYFRNGSRGTVYTCIRTIEISSNRYPGYSSAFPRKPTIRPQCPFAAVFGTPCPFLLLQPCIFCRIHVWWME